MNSICRSISSRSCGQWQRARPARKSGAPPKGTDNLVSTLQEFQLALLQRTDDKQIDELRNKVATLTSDDDVVALDDSVEITTAARGKAADVLKQLTASQIAAFLAAHADEVGDPGEMMVGAINQMLALRRRRGRRCCGKGRRP